MGTRSKEGLAALCLLANGFRAEGFAEERLKDGRITHIAYTFEDGRHVVRVHSGVLEGAYSRGTSQIDEADARAQALQAFWAFELELSSRSPGDLVRLGAQCF